MIPSVGRKVKEIRDFRPFLSLVKNIKVRTDGMKKRYRRLTFLFEDSIEIYEYLDGRYGAPGEKRREKKDITPEQIKRRNQWNRERKARHKLKTWFHENDYLVLLTYRRDARPPDNKKGVPKERV